jgi:hypothetical protein
MKSYHKPTITAEHRATAKNVNSNPVEYRRELAEHLLNRYAKRLPPITIAQLEKVRQGFMISSQTVAALEQAGVEL